MAAEIGEPGSCWVAPLWGRQEREGDRAFSAFVAYRDLGPQRSAGIVSQACGKSRVLIERWSARWGWVERAGAWDDESDRLSRERDLVELQAARRRMMEDHIAIGRALVQVTAAGLTQYDPATLIGRKKIEALSASDLTRLAETGARLELRARGESTQRIDVREAEAWMSGFVDLALSYISSESADAFLTDLDAKLGVGAFGS